MKFSTKLSNLLGPTPSHLFSPKLSEAPDLDALNLYDGKDNSNDTPDLNLNDASRKSIALSAHWQEESNELFLLGSSSLVSGDYNLNIESRADGLILASDGEWIDGDSDGTSGDSYLYSFKHTPENIR